ncbi:MAG: rhodanese-like domain-containing protein, partial [Gammaproteobacteria bacterium]|nr:rhodanese-like domain-containing protein [Gammaproteobacteria bacterium]
DAHLKPGGLLRELTKATDKRLIFYCAYGERSAMAVQAAQRAGLENISHVKGGIEAWKKSNGPITKSD